MQFILSIGWEEGIADLTQRLVQELSDNKQVLWLVTGGSNIPASVKIMESISDELSQHLSVMLADERYGEPGHADSNWTQLMNGGFVAKQATLLPTLQPGHNFEQARDYYDQIAGHALSGNQAIIAQLGIGPDGHIAGILPESIATKDTEALVVAYDSDPYRRLTLSFDALRHITADYSFAFGDGKHEPLVALQNDTISLAAQPAQILRELPEVYIYNDQIGEHKQP